MIAQKNFARHRSAPRKLAHRLLRKPLGMKTVTKRELVMEVANETGLTQHQVFDVIQKTLDLVTDTLAEGDQVVLRNFGAFQVKVTKSKIGRNPNKPGTELVIPPRAVVKFKPGKEMKERVAAVLPDLTPGQ